MLPMIIYTLLSECNMKCYSVPAHDIIKKVKTPDIPAKDSKPIWNIFKVMSWSITTVNNFCLWIKIIEE